MVASQLLCSTMNHFFWHQVWRENGKGCRPNICANNSNILTLTIIWKFTKDGNIRNRLRKESPTGLQKHIINSDVLKMSMRAVSPFRLQVLLKKRKSRALDKNFRSTTVNQPESQNAVQIFAALFHEKRVDCVLGFHLHGTFEILNPVHQRKGNIDITMRHHNFTFPAAFALARTASIILVVSSGANKSGT